MYYCNGRFLPRQLVVRMRGRKEGSDKVRGVRMAAVEPLPERMGKGIALTWSEMRKWQASFGHLDFQCEWGHDQAKI